MTTSAITKYVRDVAVYSNDVFATAEESKSIHVFQRTSNNSFQSQRVFPKNVHDNMIFVLEPLHGDLFNIPTFASGGDEGRARVWNIEGKFYPDLQPIDKQVCSIAQIKNDPNGDLITGSWDGCINVWHNGKLSQKIIGHQYATVVCALPQGGFVAGSGNREIVIYSTARTKMVTIPKAHNHVIKRLAYHPQLGCIVSAGNDGFISLWSLDGSKLNSWEAHYKSHNEKGDEQDAYIFGLAVDPEGLIYSSGQDRAVRIWQADGTLLQEVMHPGSVMSVKLFPNGDFITACGDRVARIFTRSNERKAASSERETYDSIISALGSSKVESIDLSKLPDESALLQPGKSHGATLVVNVKNRGAIAYSWNMDDKEWIEVGEAFAQAPKGNEMDVVDSSGNRVDPKLELDGKKWDRVVPVEVDATGAKTMLGFDVDEDPDEIVARFMKKHQFPEDYTEQIKQFVMPMLDADARRRRIAALRHRRDDDFKQIPSWKVAYISVSETNFPVMKQKLVDFNVSLAGTEFALSDSDVLVFNKYIANLMDQVNYHVSPFTLVQFDVLKKMLNWPTEKVLPVLDSMRILCLHHAGIEVLVDSFMKDSDFCSLVFGHLLNDKSTDIHMLFLLRLVGNLVARKKRTPEERVNGIPDGLFLEFLLKALSVFSSAATSSNKLVHVAYSILLFNISSWFGRFHVVASPLYETLLSAASNLLPNSLDERCTYYSLVCIGSVILADEINIKPMFQLNFLNKNASLASSLQVHSKNDAITEAVQDIKNLLQ